MVFSNIRMQAVPETNQRTGTSRRWGAALEAMREGGLGGSRVSTSGSHRRQKVGLRHSSAVSYPTLLLQRCLLRNYVGSRIPALKSHFTCSKTAEDIL